MDYVRVSNSFAQFRNLCLCMKLSVCVRYASIEKSRSIIPYRLDVALNPILLLTVVLAEVAPRSILALLCDIRLLHTAVIDIRQVGKRGNVNYVRYRGGNA